MDLFKSLPDLIADLDRLSERQRAKWPEYDKAGKTPKQIYLPQEQLEDDAEADKR